MYESTSKTFYYDLRVRLELQLPNQTGNIGSEYYIANNPGYNHLRDIPVHIHTINIKASSFV